MKIAEASAACGLSADTIRFYERSGMLPEIHRGGDGHRRFAPRDVEWLTLLYWLRETGMPLKQMKRFTALNLGVGQPHSAFIAQVPDWGLALVPVPTEEAPPAFGAFAVHRDDKAFLRDVNAVLAAFLGTDAHRAILASFGASQDEPSRSAD
ncbi:MerR family transcriptional regulator [Dinoroseobacter sp. S124A]|uniref:MerR family transcriptional regulator n=1 Tax=Dinoroseobacter sp. S124A TaxID=3415128 RepID=UPI003C79B4EC